MTHRCDDPCPDGTHGQNCASNCRCQNDGTCNPMNGNCFCKDGWTVSAINIYVTDSIKQTVE